MAWGWLAPRARALVDVSRPGVPVSGAVGEDAHVFAQALVAGPAEGGVAAFAGLDRDWGLAGVGGERVVGGVAGAVVADLGEQPGGGYDALGVAEEREEDRPVGVRFGGAGDLACELADLLNDGTQSSDEADHGGATCVLLELSDDGAGGATQPGEQFGGGASAAVGVTREKAFKALLAETTSVGGAGIALEERESDRAVDVGEDPFGAGPERLQLGAQLVRQGDPGVDEILTGAHERLQCQCLVAGGREHGEAVPVGSGELAQHERVEAVVLARGRSVALTRCLDLVGVDREHDDPGRQEPSDQEPVGALDRAALHTVSEQQPDQCVDAGLVVAELFSDEQLPVLVADVNVVPVAGPVDSAGCAHRFSSSSGVRLKNAGQEVPWRVLIDRPSVGRRPVAALGASHHREAHVSCGPSTRLANEALSRWWSAICAESQASPNQPSGEISLSRKENENNLSTQQGEVAL